ncbi:MAG: hypothetical protein LBT39_05505 [Treponema sp.]|nr:hypothetical protein [Treponema sp.]
MNRHLRANAGKCIALIFYNFFFCQYRAALFKGRVPVSQVDHPLDERIPFCPEWVKIYLDFTQFWIRITGFLLREYREKAWPAVNAILDSMGAVYAFAGEVYGKNLSTTRRPFYIKGFHFLLIHLFDPHLMCIPSLHVMVMIRAYTQFTAIMKDLDAAGVHKAKVAEIRRGARDITEAILYVKQHSVNCVSAAMYAMTCFDPALFPPAEAENFAARLFCPVGTEVPSAADTLPAMDNETAKAAREHIIQLYRRFLSQNDAATEDWTKPLLDFLRPL